MITTPILVHDSVTLLPGALAQFNANDLTHPFNQAVLVREIRLSLYWQGVMGGAMTLENLGNSIRLSLALGRVGITSLRAYVPFWSFGKRVTGFSETAAVQISGTGYKKVAFSWILPRPLLVPPRTSITAIATRQQSDFLSTADAALTVTARLAYSGIAMPKNFRMPDRIDVPFVSVYADASTIATAHSNELDLKNLFDEPLKIQRLIGRVSYQPSNVANDYFGPVPTLRLRTSSRKDIVGTYLPFNEVFDQLGRNLEIRHDLAPRENFDVDFNGKLSGMNPTISMIGHRSVSVREI